MDKPTFKEEHSLMQIKDCYLKTLEAQGGAVVVLENLRRELINRYKQSPAKITIQGQEVSLPESYELFDALTKKWSESDKKKALESYYKNENHTALRYLSNPNKWIDPKAELVNTTDGIATSSTFDRHMEIIALMWIAAKDNEQKPTMDSMSVDQREKLFITELAQINRAHNADARRVTGHDGKIKKVTEDDMLADKPSCSSGVQKRILQSVIGHPLIDGLLTPQKLEDELRGFIKTKFKEKMNSDPKTKSQLVEILGAYRYSEDDNFTAKERTGIKIRLNISKEEQLEFILDLSRKYGNGFTEDRLNLILNKFKSACHAEYWEFIPILDKILDDDIQNFQQASTKKTESDSKEVSGQSFVDFKGEFQKTKEETKECDDGKALEVEELDGDWVGIKEKTLEMEELDGDWVHIRAVPSKRS